MTFVLIASDELAYEKRFSDGVIKAAKEFRQNWIDEQSELILKNPLDLLCDLPGANKMLRALMDADTIGNLDSARTELVDALTALSMRIAEARFDGFRGKK